MYKYKWSEIYQRCGCNFLFTYVTMALNLHYEIMSLSPHSIIQSYILVHLHVLQDGCSSNCNSQKFVIISSQSLAIVLTKLIGMEERTRNKRVTPKLPICAPRYDPQDLVPFRRKINDVMRGI